MGIHRSNKGTHSFSRCSEMEGYQRKSAPCILVIASKYYYCVCVCMCVRECVVEEESEYVFESENVLLYVRERMSVCVSEREFVFRRACLCD